SGPAGTTFSTPLGTTTTVSPTGPTDPVRLWIGYTGTSDGDIATGTVRVRWVETGDEWEVPITANTIARPTVAVVLVLDQSNSMTFDAGDGRTRVEVLRESAVPFVDLIQEDNAIGVVAFDQDPHPVMDVTPVGPLMFGAGRTAARAAVLAHTPNPTGTTAIGDGVEIAHDKLDPVTGYDAKAMVVLTDGQETDAKYIADVMSLINERVFAIGLGTAEQIQPAALTALTNGTGGFLRMTGTIDGDDYFRLSKYYLQTLAGVTNADIVLDPEAYIAPGQTHKIPFQLNETDIGDDVILLTPAPLAIGFVLEAPDGTIVDPGVASTTPGMSYNLANNIVFYRAIFPLPLGGGSVREGTWTAILTINEEGFKRHISSLDNDQEAIQGALAHGVRYSLSVHAFSNLRFTARIDQDSHEPGATMTVTAVLTEYSLPVDHRAFVDAEIERPNGTTTTVGMVEIEPGVFELSIVATMAGIYQFQLRATGTTLRDRPFTREQGLSGVTWRGGDGDLPSVDNDPGGRDEWICDWLYCLLDGVISEDLEKRLKEAGFDLEALRRCVTRHCQRRPQRGGGRTTESTVPEIDTSPGELLEAVRTLVGRQGTG
ncbi:MAG TPA: VWA domain-containing protein, partial [Thermomicrobiales bacterium]|nr:VWA domain-containing protein [Thermomicrobiales bacterium]